MTPDTWKYSRAIRSTVRYAVMVESLQDLVDFVEVIPSARRQPRPAETDAGRNVDLFESPVRCLQITTKSNIHSDSNRTLHGGLSELDFAGLK